MLDKCVVCGETTSGKFGDTGIAVCWQDYVSGNFLIWLDEHGRQDLISNKYINKKFVDEYSGKEISC